MAILELPESSEKFSAPIPPQNPTNQPDSSEFAAADSDPEDELLNTLCPYCNSKPPIYTCPACFAETCSLDCCRKHKVFRQCTGVRDPTAFVKRSKLMTPLGIDRDFNFLTSLERDITRGVEITPTKPVGSKQEGGKQRRKRVVEVLRRRNTLVKWAPWEGFERAKVNRTTVKDGHIRWTIGWVLADSMNQTVIEHDVSEKCQIPSAFMSSRVVDQKLKEGKKCYYFLALEAPGNKKRCVGVDCTKALAEALRERSVFEYPEFVVTRTKAGPEGWEVMKDERRIVELEEESAEKEEDVKKGWRARKRAKRKAGEVEHSESQAATAEGDLWEETGSAARIVDLSHNAPQNSAEDGLSPAGPTSEAPEAKRAKLDLPSDARAQDTTLGDSAPVDPSLEASNAKITTQDPTSDAPRQDDQITETATPLVGSSTVTGAQKNRLE